MIRIKDKKLKMYSISEEYRAFLSRFDKKVSLKEERKFYGILISKDNMEYYLPFTSKVNKNTKSKLTINIRDGSNNLIAKLLLNNMIPVNIEDTEIVNISSSKYRTYFEDEIRYLNNNNIKNEIIKKVNYIFEVLKNPNHYDYEFFKSICCDFNLLEKKCIDYRENKYL